MLTVFSSEYTKFDSRSSLRVSDKLTHYYTKITFGVQHSAEWFDSYLYCCKRQKQQQQLRHRLHFAVRFTC